MRWATLSHDALLSDHHGSHDVPDQRCSCAGPPSGQHSAAARRVAGRTLVPAAPGRDRRDRGRGGDPSVATYAPQPGLPALRSAFAADLSSAYGGEVVADDVLITAGCNQAFCIVASALAGPGDNMLVQDPFYFNHGMWLDVEEIEGRRIPNDDGLIPNAEASAALIDERTTAIVLVSPGNPTGVTVPPERIAEFAALAKAKDLALIIDETYRSFRPTETPAPPSSTIRPGGTPLSACTRSRKISPSPATASVRSSPENPPDSRR